MTQLQILAIYSHRIKLLDWYTLISTISSLHTHYLIA